MTKFAVYTRGKGKNYRASELRVVCVRVVLECQLLLLFLLFYVHW